MVIFWKRVIDTGIPHRLVPWMGIPQVVVDEVIESKRNAPKGKSAEKTLWLYIFWTPDGMKMRWEVKYNEGRMHDGFGKVIKEGGDDLDRYNQ